MPGTEIKASTAVDEALGGYVAETDVAIDNSKAPVNLEEAPDVCKTMNEVMAAVTTAEAEGKDHVLVTKDVMKHLLKKDYTEDAGAFMFHNVMLYEVGKREETIRRDSMKIEEKIFGHAPLIKLAPMTTKPIKGI